MPQNTSGKQLARCTHAMAAGSLLLGMALGATGLFAQSNTTETSQGNAYNGSVVTRPATASVLPLSLDEAIQMGLKSNLALLNEQETLNAAGGRRSQAFQGVLPTLTASAQTSYHEVDLAAEGLNPSKLGPTLGPGGAAAFPLIVKVANTSAQANLTLPIVDMPALSRYRAAKESYTAEEYRVRSVRGLVVLGVGTSYLQVLANQATVSNDKSLLEADRVLLNQSTAQFEAGTATKLDALRAQVQFQQQQQVVLNDENSLEKAKNALKRQVGIPVEQAIALTDPEPYTALADLDPTAAREHAYRDRQDYQQFRHQLAASVLNLKAARYERLPTLSAGGNYGVTGVTNGLYHGTFVAAANLQFPIFRESTLRGDRDVAAARRTTSQAQLDDLRTKIDQQLRDSLFDVQTSRQLVATARSNVDLAQQSLGDTLERYKAGVADNLPVVQAQAQLAASQTQLVSSLFQFNQSKLSLARNLGLVEYDYRTYLGK